MAQRDLHSGKRAGDEMAISDYMHFKYKRDARGEDGLHIDCWGLVRLIWENELGKPTLPLFSGAITPRMQTRCYSEFPDHGLIECQPKHGAIASCIQSTLCTHVGIVIEIDGELRVIDIQNGSPVAIHQISRFSRKFTKVVFHDY